MAIVSIEHVHIVVSSGYSRHERQLYKVWSKDDMFWMRHLQDVSMLCNWLATHNISHLHLVSPSRKQQDVVSGESNY